MRIGLGFLDMVLDNETGAKMAMYDLYTLLERGISMRLSSVRGFVLYSCKFTSRHAVACVSFRAQDIQREDVAEEDKQKLSITPCRSSYLVISWFFPSVCFPDDTAACICDAMKLPPKSNTPPEPQRRHQL